MSFPVSPANGATTTINGVTYIYSSSNNSWTISSSAPKVTVASTPPSSPVYGDIWINDSNGREYIYILDGSNSLWIETSNPGVVSGSSTKSYAFGYIFG
jgi:hypothetical protein